MASKQSGKSFATTSLLNNLAAWLKSLAAWKLRFLKANWIGIVVILLSVVVYFWPLIMNITDYSPGGDAMFNAWEMRRNQNCILQQGCPDYTDANIFYPNKDTMLYSETQISAGFITLPFYWISPSPILAYNFLTIFLFFLSGLFMYLLAKYLSKGNELLSILAALVFTFSPFRIAAIYHLQNLSIMSLPLATLLVLRFRDSYKAFAKPAPKKKVDKSLPLETRARDRAFRMGSWLRLVAEEAMPGKRYLIGLLLILLYVFFASWVQMVFVLMALGILLVGLLICRLITWRPAVAVAITISVAVFATLPLALQYVQFSKSSGAGFSFREQVFYSSDVVDYFIPYEGTLLGQLYYDANPTAWHNSYNPDSYSFHGFTLYALAAILLVLAFWQRKRSEVHMRVFKYVAVFAAMAIIGFMVSLGPVLKVFGHWAFYVQSLDFSLGIPLPWIAVDKFLPQLSFLRAMGRASVLVLFALCCLLPLLARHPAFEKLRGKTKLLLATLLFGLVAFEVFPSHILTMASTSYSYHMSVPKVYEYIHDHKEVNNIIILNADYDYPGAPIPIATAEQVLWSGYHNKNIFNGYSGYTPPNYVKDFEDFVDFQADDIQKLKDKKLDYVLVDKLLMTGKPWVNDRVSALLPNKVYEDERFALYKVQ